MQNKMEISLILDAMDGDYRTVVLPTIDVISNDTFGYSRQYFPSGFAGRGVFSLSFDYKLLPLSPKTIANPSKPFETPVMAGGLFAISSEFFSELGYYDEGFNGAYGKLSTCHLKHFCV